MKIVLASQSPAAVSCWGRWDWNLPHNRRRLTKPRSRAGMPGTWCRFSPGEGPLDRRAGGPGDPGHRGGHRGGPGREILGKPKGEEEARAMLASLSERTHQVCTGVTVCRGDKVLTQVEETRVTFRPLTDQEIRQYVSTGEPMDKAGAYGIQGLGGLLVAGIQGDYHNVVGLPVCRLGRMLLDFGVDCLALAGR
ncbi:MAG: Maf family protein [Evtepia gabavorous]